MMNLRDTSVLELNAIKETIQVKHPQGMTLDLDCTLIESEEKQSILMISFTDTKKAVVSTLSYFIPQLIMHFGLNIKNVEIVFQVPQKIDNTESQDPRYFKIDFAREILRQQFKGGILSYVLLKSPATVALPIDLAFQLELAGVQLSKYNGEEVLLRTITDGDVKGVIEYYDGSRYHLKQDENKPLKVLRGTIRKLINKRSER